MASSSAQGGSVGGVHAGDGSAGGRSAPQTVIRSPFFRSEIVSAYSRDTLLADSYPTLHAASLFEPVDEQEGGVDERQSTSDGSGSARRRREDQLPPLTAANIKALQEAAQAMSAHLVLLDQAHKAAQLPQDGSEDPLATLTPAQRKLEAARLRSHLAATLLLLNEPTRALAHLNLASDTLRPPRHRKPAASGQATDAQAVHDPACSTQVDEVRITLWVLMERACLTLGKKVEFERARRWRTALELQRNPGI